MAKITLQDAEMIAQRGRPWTIRLERVGTNPSNASGRSAKYWFATGRGIKEAVEIGYGALGAIPQYRLIDWPKLQGKVAEKLTKGYIYVNTPYIRMSAANLAKLTGSPMVQPKTAKQVSSLRPRRGSKKMKPKTAPAAQAAPTAPVAGSTPPNPAIISLGVPYSLIRALKVRRQGVKITGYGALDDQGSELMILDPKDGIEFARDYNIDVNF